MIFYRDYSMNCKKCSVRTVIENSEGKWLVTEVENENFRESGKNFCCRRFYKNGRIRSRNKVEWKKRNAILTLEFSNSGTS